MRRAAHLGAVVDLFRALGGGGLVSGRPLTFPTLSLFVLPERKKTGEVACAPPLPSLDFVDRLLRCHNIL